MGAPVFVADTHSDQYEDVWDYKFFIKCRIAAPFPNGLCWFLPCDSAWDYGYVEGLVWPSSSVEKFWRRYNGKS